MSVPTWKYMSRFLAIDGQIYFAEAPGPLDSTENSHLTLTGYLSFAEFEKREGGKSISVEKFLSPTPVQTNEIVCIGTNYRKHAEEANLTVPEDPVMWYKPWRSLTDPGDVPIPKVAQQKFLDFEGELTIITSKDARDVSLEDAPNYILGYTIGNDLTARFYQDPKRAGGQFTRAKAFDKFAPLGPVLISAQEFGSFEGKRITTKVNGKVFQESTLDLIHDSAKLISFLSEGVTLPAGSAIMTGTPPGIGYFRNPKYNLKDGDVVEVSITSIGTLKNTMKFE
ncbi:uncharacterized protein BDZ99DRAFT_397450 [Mytilinidion resinicola]|uniref:Fumarylacetoacetase-like C-terminal domain-containing protein n=1 Tax=Mytilinidion resinicola TaxID=574789 RepID=A0A6A6Y7L2_9PEZI|nr:uncharacterized protein BDZ99DRAFT_397450 [Mytilinidion resinicola]KAF2804538.1 hypothetical protein BDZ99DRAFT_397450 [Mytilinidion resinicola]